jgi:di/tricarboxylate transporter
MCHSFDGALACRQLIRSGLLRQSRAACDVLTPIGHPCNTLVMGPGGYRFGDYWRLGLPLSLLVLAVGGAV